MRIRAVAFIFVVGCGAGLPARPEHSGATSSPVPTRPPDITGFWRVPVPTEDGHPLEVIWELEQRGEKVTGEARAGSHKASVSDGTFLDGRLHLTFEGSPAIFDGTLEGETLSLVRQTPGKPPSPRKAERTTREGLLPPRLPLPALHDVRDNGLSRTPPMGWNSWNKFGDKVDDATVRGIADAIVASGMRDAGYAYVNIDDTWAGARDAQGNITPNRKFPDMKALADYVHSKGLKIGIYSSPGPKTCMLYEGSYGHEEQDAATFAAWGIDYLKYDWCTAEFIYKNEEMQAVYQKMGDALSKAGRPIVFSLCQYGLDDVWKWGPAVGGNLWRTTKDIEDRYASMAGIGFGQFDLTPYAGPGRWNDPDMLEVGNGGMSADEYRTQMSLWSLLAAPLLAGNDLRAMSDETRSILTNAEVLAIDQSPRARPARRISEQGAAVVVARPLEGDALAVGLFNRGEAAVDVAVTWAELGLRGKRKVRDLWALKDRGAVAGRLSATVPAHGVVLVTLRP